MILHAALHWPQQSNVKLWPLAMDYAVWLWNRIPHWKSGYSPLELFTQLKSSHVDLNRARIWGTLLYVLDPILQNGFKLPKWSQRSSTGIFVGFSAKNSSTVTLALDVSTGSITPPFHVVHDEYCTTVTSHENLDLDTH